MSSNSKLFIFLIIFYCLLFISFNVKSYLLVFIFAFCLFFFYFKYTLTKSVFLILITSLPFENNLREWLFTVTQPLYTGILFSGYFFYFGISLKLIFGIFVFLLFLSKKDYLKNTFINDWPLIIFFIIACINTFYNFSIIPIVGLIRLWLSILIYFSAKIFFKSEPKLFPIVIASIYFFSTLIGVNQLIKQKPLGKFIELTPGFSQEKGYSTTDGKSQYRVAGFISHPVYFGSFISIIIPIFIAFSLSSHIPLTLPLTLLGIMVALGTNSRSVWINLAFSIYFLYPYIKKKFHFKNIPNAYKLIIPIILCITTIIVITRLESITNIFSEHGNASIRLQLIWQSLQIIGQHPFGVGLNQFTLGLIELPIPQNITGFIVPVHNTFLLIITELGIIAGSLFIYFVIKSIFFRKINPTYKLVTYGAILGAITFLISSQLHPLFNLDPTFDLFMLTLGYINSQCQTLKT